MGLEVKGATEGMTTEKPAADPGTPSTLLIVDDDPGALQMLATYFTRQGYQIIEARGGAEALEALQKTPPDAIILDVMMPNVDGMKVLETIRERFQPAEMPVILLTALDDKKDVVRGLELGASDYVSKPVDITELAARVRNQVRTKRMLEQNRKSFAALKEIDEIKDKFLQITAHDLKSPLGTISMGIQILEDAVPQVVAFVPEYERIIQMMSYASNVMQTIVSDYLDLQALKTGRLELDVQAVPLNMHVMTVVDNLRPYAESKGITVQAELDPMLPMCSGDPDRLAQVINNLVNNAIKFSPRGASVFVRTKGLDSKLRVEVKDSGPGIPPQEIPLLFEEFSRLSNRPTGGEKSSGVGLAISKSLIEAHHRQIGVETAVGQGSMFWVELPCQGKVQV